MPQYYIGRAEKKINNLKEEIEKNKEIKIEKKEEPKVQKRRGIKNIKKNANEEKMNLSKINGHTKLELLKDSLFISYMKIIAIYFILCFILMAFNWYMMTSFCSIYLNTGVKILVNSLVSLFISFIIPLILGLIPTLLGFLAYKTGNRINKKLYEIINFII